MLQETTSPARSDWNAVRISLVADLLRGETGDRHSDSVPVRSDGPQTVRLQVFGESMLPALWPGDVVEIASCSLRDLHPGEIVLALGKDGDSLFLHRFVARDTPDGFVLRGDSMPDADSRYPENALLGRLVGIVAEKRSMRRSALRPGVGSRLSRAVGLLLCHFRVLRRLALQWHRSPTPSLRESGSL